MAKIEIVIKPTGESTIKVNGVSGPQCKDLSAIYSKLLPGTVISDTPTPEMYITAENTLDEDNRINNER